MKYTIDKKYDYTLGEIARLKLIPGIDTTPKAVRLVQKDWGTTRILNAKLGAFGTFGTRYFVKGENIIKYLEQHGKKSGKRS